MARDRYPELSSLEPVGGVHRVRGEFLDHGPGNRQACVPHAVVALPLVRRGKEVHAIGLTPKAPRGLRRQLVVRAFSRSAHPNGYLPIGPLTEPIDFAATPSRGESRRAVPSSSGCGLVVLPSS